MSIQRLALVAGIKSRGLTESAKTLSKLCKSGQAQVVLEAVAEVLLDDSRIPPNAGVLSKDFLIAVEAALLDVAEAYNASWNPLTPRYASVDQLHSEMVHQWRAGFRKPIPETVSVRNGLLEEEIGDKLTIMAQMMRGILRKACEVTVDATGDSIWVFRATDLESICKEAAHTLLEAFEKPNEANHKLIHGDRHD